MRAALLVALAAGDSAFALLDASSPVWLPSSNATVETYAFFRSPVFVLPVPVAQLSSAALFFTAQASPNVGGGGTTQSKLLGAAKLGVNGVHVTAGPGHSVPQTQHAVQSLSVLSVLRDAPSANVLSVASYFNNKWKAVVSADTPGVQVELHLTSADGQRTWVVAASGGNWTAFDATRVFRPGGDEETTWFHMPSDNVYAPARPVGWEDPTFVADPALWLPAAVVSPFPKPLYLEPAAPPAFLWRSACNISTLPPPAGPCGVAAEKATLTLSCEQSSGGAGGVIQAITFASYGTPSGQCAAGGGDSFARNASCDAQNSTAVLSALCVGRPSCSLVVGNAPFGVDPCHLTPKRLAASASCTGGGGAPAPVLYHYLLDFGQEMMGGLNLTWPGPIPAGGASVVIKLGEELLANGTGGVMVPTRADENYTSVWTLAPSPSVAPSLSNTGMTGHEFIQFRYAEVMNSPVPLGPDNVRAWVVQHPFDGTGVNPYELPCSTSTPNLPLPSPAARGAGTANTAPPPSYGWFSSSSPGLDAVFNLTAYTAIATTLDINVDSQTRQRDLCHIDALITGHEQYAIFPPGDYAIQRRTFRDAYGNDSAIWSSWTEFKQSGALMAWLDAVETGDTSIGADTWSDSDESIVSDTNPSVYASVQFYAGVRYFNGSGTGLLHYPNDCGGAWACDPLVDWPTNTRDGYVVSGVNTDDAVRNGLGAVAIDALSQLSGWLGKTVAAARYASMAVAIRSGFLAQMLRMNQTAPEAYFTDGAGVEHAAVHSSVYGVISGAASGNATLSSALAAYLIRRDVVPSSCMTGRWYGQAMYQLGVMEPAAADYALWLLSRPTYPSWGNMIVRGATTTLEAWQPEDKWNTDWAHPWCAAPAFLIPRWLMGVQPAAPGWTRFTAQPQPGNLTTATARLPTPLGPLSTTFAQQAGGPVTLSLDVPAGTSGQVCLPPLHPHFAPGDGGAGGGDFVTGGARAAYELHVATAVDGLTVDGVSVPSTAVGRLLCTVTDVPAGAHTVTRAPAVA